MINQTEYQTALREYEAAHAVWQRTTVFASTRLECNVAQIYMAEAARNARKAKDAAYHRLVRAVCASWAPDTGYMEQVWAVFCGQSSLNTAAQ